MTIFDHPLWPRLRPYAAIYKNRENLDLLQLPDDLRDEAKAIELPCVSCGSPCRVFRARLKSARSRVGGKPEERRLFYASTCPSHVNAGCARSRAAKDHKRLVRDALGERVDDVPSIRVEVLDASGAVLLDLRSEVREAVSVDLPAGATSLRLVPRI